MLGASSTMRNETCGFTGVLSVLMGTLLLLLPPENGDESGLDTLENVGPINLMML